MTCHMHDATDKADEVTSRLRKRSGFPAIARHGRVHVR